MSFNVEGECRNTGRTHFPKGIVPWNKGLVGVKRIHPIVPKIDKRKFGHSPTEETRKKMSESLKGKPSWAKGKKFSAKHRMKMSQSPKFNPTTKKNY